MTTHGNYTQKEFEPSLKVYVKKSAENAYKTATGWSRYAGQISYKIPGEINIAHWYGTFAREFDADLGIYARENNEAGRHWCIHYVRLLVCQQRQMLQLVYRLLSSL